MMDHDKKERPEPERKAPRRYKIYDGLNISVSAINIVIYVLIGLILLSVLAGMTAR
jgi:hypothetical protein